MCDGKCVDKLTLPVDCGSIRDYGEYKDVWKRISRVRITLVEKNEECRHCEGESFVYENPYKRPQGVCEALLYVCDLYIWRAAFGFPSWNESDHAVYRIHCPDPKGTVWEMRREP